MHRRLGQTVQRGHVIFMHMAKDHEIAGIEFRADVVGDDWRIERRLRVGAAHDHLVGIGIFAVLLAEEDGDAAEIGARNRASA